MLTTLTTVSLRLRQVPARSGGDGEPQQRARLRLAALRICAAAAIHPATGPIARSALFTLSGTDGSVWTFMTNLCPFTFSAASGVHRKTRSIRSNVNDNSEQTVSPDTIGLLHNYFIHHMFINKLSRFVSRSKLLCVYL